MKVLIISHNPLCTYDNMGKTILSLFSCFGKEEICQLYVYPSMPDVDKCASYFRITDSEVLRSLIPFSRSPGKEITVSGDAVKYKAKSTRKDITQEQESFLYMMRDIAWRVSAWNSDPLGSWLDKENPDVIFFCPGSSKFIYEVAERISLERRIPLVTYICDDFYFLEGETGFFRSLQLKQLKKRISATMRKTYSIVTICEEMRRSYEKEFGLPVHTVMTGAGISRHDVKEVEQISNISYFGNLTLNRYLSIAEIGRALDEINNRTGRSIQLRVYSRNDNNTVRTEFSGIESLKMMGYLSGDEYNKAFFDSDVLIHTEAFDVGSIKRVKNSVSTKIADSLASGILLFAYGPRGIASMDHLEENRCAWIVNQRSDLGRGIENMLSDHKTRNEIVDRELKTAARCHDSEFNSQMIRSILGSAIDGS